MARLSKAKIGEVLRAKRREPVKTPFYYVPPFLDELRRSLQERLASTGGRPTVREWEVVRKTRFSKETWQYLSRNTRNRRRYWSRRGNEDDAGTYSRS
jgi:hypothetical protein